MTIASCSILPVAPSGAAGQYHNGIPGYSFKIVSCVGNAAEGKVYVTFNYIHNLAPQSVSMGAGNNAYAIDYYGNRYKSVPFNGQYRKSLAGVTEKVVLEVNGVPPGIGSFSLIHQGFVSNTIDVANSRKETDIIFRNIPIDWKK